jgi:wyosine [tRNA(Phe)-imidazoG37] synthetase (radical SAM superfamily)
MSGGSVYVYHAPMNSAEHHIAFGPVPSRRLGRSLGINNVTAKVCSYGCVYCQVGMTTEQCVQPRPFFSPEQIHAAVAQRLDQLAGGHAGVDYLTFVPDGEPTLDSRLGESIAALRSFAIPVAVISNASLVSRPQVREALAAADLVSLKVDTVDEALWRRINRPHPALRLPTILQGIQAFASDYTGTLISDTMLLAGINDEPQGLAATADFLAGIALDTAYLAVPTRPTTVAGIQGSDPAGLLRAHQIFAARLSRVELLTGHEVGEFAHTGNAREDLLAITAVHPMREDDVRRLLAADGADWTLLEQLVDAGELLAIDYQGQTFYLRPVRR